MVEQLLQKQGLEKHLMSLGMPEKPKEDSREQTNWRHGAYTLLTITLDRKFKELIEYCSQIPEYLNQKEPGLEESELVGHVLSEINPLLISFNTLVLEFYGTINQYVQKNMNEKMVVYETLYKKFIQRTRIDGLPVLTPQLAK